MKPAHPRVIIACVLSLLCLLAPAPRGVAAATPTPGLAIVSPVAGSEVGGYVSILGTVDLGRRVTYVVSFGPGDAPVQWIPLAAGQGPVRGALLAFWDTTVVPDGLYTLRLRAVLRGSDGYIYRDALVSGIRVRNAPPTVTPLATLPPTPTATVTPTPTATATPLPRPGLGDAASPYLYVSQMAQFDPICRGWDQRYSIWVSNVGLITVTQVLVTDTLPLGVEPIQEGTSPGASYLSSQRALLWTIPSMAPGEAHKFELHVSVADWLSLGEMLINQVDVSCDQIGPLTSLESALFSDCPWMRQTAEARALVLPTLVPSSTPSPTRTVTAEPSVTPLRPTVTPILLASNPPRQPLDLLTLIVAAVVAVLFVVTLVLIYRRVVRRG